MSGDEVSTVRLSYGMWKVLYIANEIDYHLNKRKVAHGKQMSVFFYD